MYVKNLWACEVPWVPWDLYTMLNYSVHSAYSIRLNKERSGFSRSDCDGNSFHLATCTNWLAPPFPLSSSHIQEPMQKFSTMKMILRLQEGGKREHEKWNYPYLCHWWQLGKPPPAIGCFRPTVETQNCLALVSQLLPYVNIWRSWCLCPLGCTSSHSEVLPSHDLPRKEKCH